MIKSYFDAWKRPFDFKGISNRKEYWSFTLMMIPVFILINTSQSFLNNLKDSLLNTSGSLELLSTLVGITSLMIHIFSYFYLCGVLWTTIPLTVRRIRDVGKSWTWSFVALIPYVGIIFALIFLTRKSTPPTTARANP